MSEAALKQRPLASLESEKLPAVSTPSGTSSRLSAFDYVLKVELPVDTKSLSLTKEADIDLQKLIKTLDLNKFLVEIRPDYNSNYLLVFVKLADSAFESLLKEATQIDAIFGVSPQEKLIPSERLRLVYYKLTGLKIEGGAGLTIGEGNWKYVTAILPVSILGDISKEGAGLKSSSIKLFNSEYEEKQSNFILNTFGSKYAFYFKFSSTYLVYTIALAAIGLICNFFFGRYSLAFAIINMLLGTIFYLNVYFNEAQLAQKWKLQNVSKVEVSRTENRDPNWQVLAKRFVFIPIAIVGAVSLISGQFACFLLEITITEIYDGPYKSVLALVPTILVSALVPIATAIYTLIVNHFLTFENNPTRSEHNKSFLVKTFVFNFLASYMALFITAFIYLPFGYKINPFLPEIVTYADGYVEKSSFISQLSLKKSGYSVNSLRLNNQYKYFILTNQIVALLLEFVLPQVLSRVLALPAVQKLMGAKASVEIELKDSSDEAQLLTEVRDNFKKPAFDVDSEYRQLVIQFGYMILFGSVWAVGPVISVIINIIQMKGDYAKLLKFTKTPLPDRAESSYPWPLFVKGSLFIGAFSSTAISCMYSGGNIVSSSSLSSVKYEWYQIIPFGGLATISVQVCAFFGEWIIDEYFSDDVKKTQYARKVQSEFIELSNVEHKSVNNVPGILKTAASFSSTLAVKEETEKTATKKSD